MVPVFHLQMLLQLLCVITGANICSDLLNFNKMMLFLFEFYLAIPEPQVLLFNRHTSTALLVKASTGVKKATKMSKVYLCFSSIKLTK